MGLEEVAGPSGKSHYATLYADVPEHLKRVYRQRKRDTGQDRWPPLNPSETVDIKTTEQAWAQLVGELTPTEWANLGGPVTLSRIVRYLVPSEFGHIRGPYAVVDEAERDRLAILLWRHLVIHRKATPSR